MTNKQGLNIHRKRANRLLYLINQADPMPKIYTKHHNDIEDWERQYCEIMTSEYQAQNKLIEILSYKLKHEEEISDYWYNKQCKRE